MPQIVREELRHDEAPKTVRRWIAEPPSWIEIAPTEHDIANPDLQHLDAGERAAIQLAIRIKAELLLLDDRDGVRIARSMGFAVTGTLGILDLAAHRGLIQMNDAIKRLRNTSFPSVRSAFVQVFGRHANLNRFLVRNRRHCGCAAA